jgi:hypothetical protein
MSRPLPNESAAFYHYYIGLTAGEEAVSLPERHSAQIAAFFSSLPPAKGMHTYAAGKWTLNQVIQHLVDVERVFVYRLLWIVRRDQQPLPGFDENSFAANASASHRKLTDLIDEWLLLRKSTDRFIAQLSDEELACTGIANGSLISAKALCFIIYGHILHHIDIIDTRYLDKD